MAPEEEAKYKPGDVGLTKCIAADRLETIAAESKKKQNRCFIGDVIKAVFCVQCKLHTASYLNPCAQSKYPSSTDILYLICKEIYSTTSNRSQAELKDFSESFLNKSSGVVEKTDLMFDPTYEAVSKQTNVVSGIWRQDR